MFTVLALMLPTVTAHAQETELVFEPLNVDVQVTDILREHGIFVDKYTFTVDVTNQGNEVLFLDLGVLWLDVGHELNDCEQIDWHVVKPDQTLEIVGCYTADSNYDPAAIAVYGYARSFDTGKSGLHYRPFVSGECDLVPDNASCQSVQRINHLVRDVEPEPMQCKAPAITNSVLDINNAIYHTGLNDIVISFNEHVELVEDWRDNTTILAKTADGLISQDGLRSSTDNITPPGNMMWLTLSYSDYKDIRNATEITLLFEPQTILYNDGQTNTNEIIVGLEMIP